MRYLGPQLWARLPNDIRPADSLRNFKKYIRKIFEKAALCKLWMPFMFGIMTMITFFLSTCYFLCYYINMSIVFNILNFTFY